MLREESKVEVSVCVGGSQGLGVFQVGHSMCKGPETEGAQDTGRAGRRAVIAGPERVWRVGFGADRERQRPYHQHSVKPL